jgi:hypothetical protein
VRTLDFARELTYTGNKVLVRVRLVGARQRHRIEMALDTGSELSILNRRFIGAVGLDVTAGEPITLMVANGEFTQAWVHPVEIEVFGERMTIEAAFCPDWNTQNLLGMRGFTDQFVVAFDHAHKRIYV